MVFYFYTHVFNVFLFNAQYLLVIECLQCTGMLHTLLIHNSFMRQKLLLRKLELIKVN